MTEGANSEQDQGSKSNKIVLVGLAISLIYGILFIVGSAKYIPNFWVKFNEMTPNEFGDFLAGLSAPLAFLWLVVAVFVQRGELANQIAEFKRSVNLTQQQVELLREEGESRKRTETKAKIAGKFARIAAECMVLGEIFADTDDSMKKHFENDDYEECISYLNKIVSNFNENQGSLNVEWKTIPYKIESSRERVSAHSSIIIQEILSIISWNTENSDEEIYSKIRSSHIEYLKINLETILLHFE